MTEYQPSEYTETAALASQVASIAHDVELIADALKLNGNQLTVQGFGGYADFHLEERLETITAALRYALGRAEATKQYTHTATDRRNERRYQEARAAEAAGLQS